MAQDIVNENQKISYTNLDFSAIYTETLNLIKQLTYKWDPSISDESDPGVILVKLSALLADKMNYNIDKNVLETFPLSVTQEGNARQLYDQLGYYMDWYQSGSVDVAISWIGQNDTEDIKTYKIPKFTPICDTEQSTNKRFTIIGVEGAEDKVVSDIMLSTDGTIIVAHAMEGFPVQYQFEGETVITSQMVDPISRRLYFTTRYISQNGVFIKNTGQENYAEWHRVNNLYENTYNELRYVFGYDSQSDTCFLEFPDNYAELIGSGIEITYLLVDPNGGEAMPQELTQLMASLSVTDSSSDSDVTITLSNENVKILNYVASTGHADIEGIDEAYTNYKRTVGTFKTLITLRDYLNYIRSEDLDICSNAFVCDRTNDIQSVYKIMNKGKDLTNLVVKVEQSIADQNISSVFDYNFVITKDAEVEPGKTYYQPDPNSDHLIPVVNPSGSPAYNRYYELESIVPQTDDALESFTLKFYMLRKSVALESLAAYNQTFTMLYPYPDFNSLFADTAHLEHIYGDILPIGKNYYMKSKDEEWSDTKAYYMYDPEEQTYTLITNISDYSESAPIDLEYVYEIKIEALMPHIIFFKTLYPLSMNVSTYNVYDEETQTDIKTNIINNLYKTTSSSEMNFGEEASVEYLTRMIRESDTRIKDVNISPLSYYLYATYFDDEQKAYYEVEIDSDMGNLTPESYESEVSIIANTIKKDIIAKSILAGVTQLIIPDTEFIYHLPQKFISYENNVVEVSPEAVIDIASAVPSYTISNTQSVIRKTYTLQENEKLTLFRPKLVPTDEFLSGIHFEYLIGEEIGEGEAYKLKPGEYFIFYTVNKSEYDNGVVSYTAHAYSNGKIIQPTFKISKQDSVSSMSNFARSQIIPQFEVDLDLQEFNETTSNNTYMTEIGNSSSILSNTITGNDKVEIKILATVDLEIGDKYKFFWVLNKATYSSNDNIRTYTIFNEYDSEEDSKYYDDKNVYTLKSGEVFLYADDRFTQANMLGSGTTLKRNCGVETAQYSEVENSLYYAEINHLSLIVPESSFTSLTDNDDLIRPREQGLYVITDENPIVLDDTVTNPFEQNLYEKIEEPIEGEEATNDFFVPSLDTEVNYSKTYYKPIFERTTDVTAKSLEHYYVLVMRKESGYFIKSSYLGLDGISREIYNSDSDNNCFEAVNVIDMDNPKIIDPVKEGYYKEVTFNGSYYDDEYSLAEGIDATIQHRFTKAADVLSTNNLTSKGNEYLEHDSTIYSRKVLSYREEDTSKANPYKDIDITNPETYIDIDLASGDFSPTSLKLIIPKKYRVYFADNDGSCGEEVEVTYLTDPYTEKLWVLGKEISYETVTPGEADINPHEQGWWEKDGNTYQATEDEKITVGKVYYLEGPHRCYSYADEPDYVHFSPWFEKLEKANDLALFSEVESTFETTIPNKGCYYKPNSVGTTYMFKGVGSTAVPYLSTSKEFANVSVTPLNLMYSLYASATAISPYGGEGSTTWLEYVNKNWKTTVSFQSPWMPKPEEWSSSAAEPYEYDSKVTYNNEAYKCVVTEATSGTWVPEEWARIDTCWRTASFNELEDQTIGSLTNYANMYALVDANSILDHQINVGIIYPAFKTDETQSDNPKYFVEARFALTLGVSADDHPYEKVSEVGVSLENDLMLMSIFPNVKFDITKYATLQLYYTPKLYVFNDFVTYSSVTYYTPKKLYRQHCGVIDAWTCTAEDKDDLLEDPEAVIGSSWQSLQPDTSLTVIDNEFEVLSVGDRLIFESDDISEESINWPVFNNDEVTLDLSNYRVSYIKSGSSEITQVKQLKIDDYKWKGYSSLIVNASSRSGQRLRANHYVEVFDDAAKIDPVTTIRGSDGDNVSIQFKYPIESQSGYYIDVTSVDATTKEDLPNSIYVFEPYPDGDYYKYGTVDYATSLMFNSVLVSEGEGDEPNEYAPQEIEIPFGLPGGEYLLGAFMKEGVDLQVVNNNYFDVNGTKFNLDAPVINDEGDTTYILDLDHVNQLHSYSSEDRTRFTGDNYDYIYMNTGDGKYRKLIAPSLIAIDQSPAELELYENNDGKFEKSTKAEKGVELVIEAPVEVGKNPKELGWYEKHGSTYLVTSDTVVPTDEEGQPTKMYYMEPDLYVDISKVESTLVFNITKHDKDEPFTSQPVNYLLDDIFKFEPNSALGDFKAIKDKVRQLDVDEEYAYTYVPSSNDLIENPLAAKSFYNVNHVYNAFTIPQLDFENLRTEFVTRRKTN